MTVHPPARRALSIVAVAVATLAVLGGAAFALSAIHSTTHAQQAAAGTPIPTAAAQRPDHQPNPCTAAPNTTVPDAAASASVAAGPTGASSRAALRQLAHHLTPAPADTGTGPYTVITYRQWATDMTGNRHTPGTSTMTVADHHRVISADGSGRETVTQYPAGTVNPTPRIAGATTSTSDPSPGAFREGIAPPVSADPAVLAAQINDVQPWDNGPFAGLRAIADTAMATYLPCPVRAAALTVFADMDAQHAGPTTDRAGRPGIAITVDSNNGAVRDTLIVEAHTGVVLAYQLQLLRNPGGYRGTFPRIDNYLLFLTSQQQAAPASAPATL